MTTWRLLTTAWSAEPTVLLGCTMLIAGYVAMTRRRPSRDAWYFFAGVVVLLIAQCSPLDALGDAYLFSAHMIQHLLLLLIVPPLVILGIPVWLAERWLAAPPVRTTERLLRQPAVAWLLGIGVMYLWHLPALYNATLAHAGIHIIEHLCFLMTGVIFWWPVCAPLPASRYAPLAAMLFLFTAAVAGSVLGIILTFASPGLYPAYLHPVDTRGLLPLIRNGWGLSPAADQQLGGLMMWVPGGLVYLCAIIGTFARWQSEPERGVLSAEC
ncbi:MAG: cytochrome c oxidase assembly protein [Thermomicrobiales bacterium]